MSAPDPSMTAIGAPMADQSYNASFFTVQVESKKFSVVDKHANKD
jgi:hypothetical protein